MVRTQPLRGRPPLRMVTSRGEVVKPMNVWPAPTSVFSSLSFFLGVVCVCVCVCVFFIRDCTRTSLMINVHFWYPASLVARSFASYLFFRFSLCFCSCLHMPWG